MADWDLLEGEPARAFAAFCIYRNLEPYERSLNAAYAQHSGRPGAADLRAPGTWAEWSSAWRWVDRAAAYDAYLDAERRKIREARARELAGRRADVEFENQAALEQWLGDLDAKLREAIAKGFEEIEREFARGPDGDLVMIKEKKRIKFPAFGSIARILRERHETARQAIEGPQLAFHLLETRYRGFSGPVGSGKSFAGAQEALKLAYLNAGSVGLIGSPTYPLLRDTTRSTFLEVLEANGVPYTLNKSDNDLWLPECGAKILFRTMMEPERLRGYNLGWFWVDELTYCRPDSWTRLVARLRHKRARHKAGIATWTPKGWDWVYRAFVSAETRKDGYGAVFATPRENERHLVEGYYDQLSHDYDARFYKQEVLGEYLNVFSGQAYHNFDRKIHVQADLDFDPRLPLHWSLDFNIDPAASILAQLADVSTQRDTLLGRERHEVRFLDEIILLDARTVHVCAEFLKRVQALRARFGAGTFSRVYVYGDASGTQRRSSALETDWDQVRKFLAREGFDVYWRVPEANPEVRQRVATFTAALLNDAGERSAYFSPKCRELIADCEQVGWKRDAHDNVLDDLDKRDPARTHASDAAGYMIYRLRKPVGGPRGGQSIL